MMTGLKEREEDYFKWLMDDKIHEENEQEAWVNEWDNAVPGGRDD